MMQSAIQASPLPPPPLSSGQPPPPAQPPNAVDSASTHSIPVQSSSTSSQVSSAPPTTGASTAPPSRPTSCQSTPPPPPSTDKFDNPLSDAARAAKSASQWNGLLRWARGARLAQGGVSGGWDWGSGSYHVPRDSPEYWSGVEKAPVDPSAPRTTTRPRTISSHPVGLDSDEEEHLQENLSGRPRRRGAARAGAYAEQL